MEFYFDLTTKQAKNNLLDSFRFIYENGFPDENEREDYDVLLNRVTLQKKTNEPYTVIVLDTHDANNFEKEVTGGLILDWYEKSETIHLIYLIVSDNHRKKGIAKKLINEGISKVIEWIKAEKGIEIKNVVFESNNPYETETDNFDQVDRLLTFSSLGAKWINLKYVQPPLDPNKKIVNNLFLLTFTQFNRNKDSMSTKDIKAFLSDLYEGLGVPDKENNLYLKKMYHELDCMEDENRLIQLEDLIENSKFIFEAGKVSVTYHFVENCSDQEKEIIEIENCNHFYSFEKDLLNFQNQTNSPIKSKFVKLTRDYTLIFPKVYQYTSESKTHIRIVPIREIKVSISLSYTYFIHSKIKIWHLTISPDNKNYFTELDVIKLASWFGSNQEKTDVKGNFKFFNERDHHESMTFLELFEKLSLTGRERIKNVNNAGIIQLVSENIDEKTIDKYFKHINDEKRPEIKEENAIELAKTICGMIEGIFDFNRMDKDEIYDTIKPFMADDSSYLSICRGTLLKFSKGDEIMNIVNDTIIISPYLLIPSAVLVHNETILNTVKKILDDSSDKLSNQNLNRLLSNQESIHRLINHEYIEDVFQYPTENEIISKGDIERGYKFLYLKIQVRLKELEDKISRKRNKIKMYSDAMIVSILFIIAALQFGKEFLSLTLDQNFLIIGLPSLLIVILSFLSIKKII